MTQSDLVRAMFTRIARRYDLMNSLMTGGRHHAWRAVVARAAAAAPPGPALDLATGTADLALALPFADKTFACVASAFLLRNLADLPAGLAEMRRVTVPGGVVAALEITRPGVPGWDALFGLYFNRLVPRIGALVAGDRAAYTYLPQSVERFVTPAELGRLMERVGLREVQYRRLGLGTIALHVASA